jgi:hypothetical protein
MGQEQLFYGLGGLLLGIGAVIGYSLLIGRGAKVKAQAILDEGQRQADLKIRDAESTIKEMELKREAEAERMLG